LPVLLTPNVIFTPEDDVFDCFFAI
jgi:hypothetical protein